MFDCGEAYPEYPLKTLLLLSSHCAKHTPKHTSEAYPMVKHPGPGTSKNTYGQMVTHLEDIT